MRHTHNQIADRVVNLIISYLELDHKELQGVYVRSSKKEKTALHHEDVKNHANRPLMLMQRVPHTHITVWHATKEIS
jgi:hypothetical protein